MGCWITMYCIWRHNNKYSNHANIVSCLYICWSREDVDWRCESTNSLHGSPVRLGRVTTAQTWPHLKYMSKQGHIRSPHASPRTLRNVTTTQIVPEFMWRISPPTLLIWSISPPVLLIWSISPPARLGGRFFIWSALISVCSFIVSLWHLLSV